MLSFIPTPIALIEQALPCVNKALNSALDLDPVAAAAVAQIADQCLEIACEDPELTLHITFAASWVKLQMGPAEQPQAILHGRLTDLLRLVADGKLTSAVTIEGDTTLLTTLQKLARSYRPDLARALTFLEPKQADAIANLAEAGLSALQNLADVVGDTLKRKAGEHFSTSADVTTLLQDLDQLRMRVDRLATKITEREAKVGSAHSDAG